MCSNCDGRIPVEASQCPYCGAVSSGQFYASPADSQVSHQALQDSLTALYTPPYAAKQPPVEEKKKTPSFQEAVVDKQESSLPTSVDNEEQEMGIFWPMLLMSVGGIFMVLGLLQFFFSDQGVLTLEWSSAYWFFYCLISLPLLYFGFQKTNALK